MLPSDCHCGGCGQLSIRNRIALIIAVAIASFVFIVFEFSQYSIMNGLKEIERSKVSGNIDRILSVTLERMNSLSILCEDWSTWDESYNYVEGRNPDFVKENLPDTMFAESNIDVFAMAVSPEKYLYVKALDSEHEREEKPPAFVKKSLEYAATHLKDKPEADRMVSGFLVDGETPYFIVIRDIKKTDGSGNTHGLMLMGRKLDEKEIAAVSRVTGYPVSVRTYSSMSLPRDFDEAKSHLTSADGLFLRDAGDVQSEAFRLVDDMFGGKALILKTSASRDEYTKGNETINYFLSILLVAGAFFTGLVIILIQMNVTRKLTSLSSQVAAIASSADHRGRVTSGGKDEISKLAGSINYMLFGLENSQRALMESEERFRSLIENVNVGIFRYVLIGDTGAFAQANSSFASMLGYATVESVMRTTLHEHAQNPDDIKQIIQEIIITGRVKNREIRLWRFDGTPIWALCSMVGQRGDSGTIEWIDGVFEDITDIKATHEELRKARDAAEAASQAKGDFLANVSHEIRTPMNGVIGMTDLLLSTSLSRDQRDYCELINSSAESLLSILNDILDYSKIEAQKIMLDIAPFDLRNMLEEIAMLFAPRAAEKKVEILLRFPPDGQRWIYGDRLRLRQIITNLINNAVKFTEKGHVLINADCIERDGDMVSYIFSIEDTGIGIEEEKIDTIFSVFTQADSSTTRKYGGTGLGLAIVKRLVTLMGGMMEVSSRLGKGSTFSFALQFRIAPDDPEGILAVEKLAGEIRSMKVLAVDDNHVNTRILREFLAGWGLVYDTANSAREALYKLRRAAHTGDPYDIAIIDYQMPVIDGESLGIAIKAEPLFGNIKLIMLTSGTSAVKAEQIRELGFDAFVLKPIRQSQLLDMLVTVKRQGLPSESRLPVYKGPLPDAAEAAKEAFHGKLASAALPEFLKVLIVEDNKVNQMVAKTLLRKMNCHVEIAENGRIGVDMTADNKYDIIFMDCQMPVMDGFEATKAIRTGKGNNAGTAIVAMTANAMQGDKERCIAAGMNDYLSKPIKAAEVKAVMDKYCGRANMESSGARERMAQILEGIAPIDFEQAMAVVDGDIEMLGEIAELFFEEAPLLLERLEAAVAEGDQESAKREAHSFKGASGNMGAKRVQLIALESEMSAKNGDIEFVRLMLPLLKAELDAFRSEYESIEWSKIVM